MNVVKFCFTKIKQMQLTELQVDCSAIYLSLSFSNILPKYFMKSINVDFTEFLLSIVRANVFSTLFCDSLLNKSISRNSAPTSICQNISWKQFFTLISRNFCHKLMWGKFWNLVYLIKICWSNLNSRCISLASLYKKFGNAFLRRCYN